MPKDIIIPVEALYDTQALNIPSKQHFQAYSAVCFATGMAILI
jgi:hypothetical protein